MSLGALTVVEKLEASAPVIVARCTLVGDSSYPTGGSGGLLAKLQAALGGRQVNIISVQGEGPNGDRHLEYNHAADKLLVRVMSTGVETANTTNESGVTYGLTVHCG